MSVEFLALAALAGIEPDRFLRADDLELTCLFLVAEKAIEFQQQQQKNLAALIINFLGKALGGDKTSGVS